MEEMKRWAEEERAMRYHRSQRKGAEWAIKTTRYRSQQRGEVTLDMVPRHALIQTTTTGFHIDSSHCCSTSTQQTAWGKKMNSARTMVTAARRQGQSAVTTVRWWAALTLQRE